MTTHTERFFQSADGLQLFARDYPAIGEERGVPVFCIHGLTRNSADFEGVAPAIAALGRRVLAIDVRGRGRSDHDPDPSRYRPDVYANDVLLVLDALAISRAIFVGTSMGGLIIMLLAVIAPERIEGAVLNDVGPVLNAVGLARIAGYVGKSGPYDSWDSIVDAIKVTQSVAFPDADEALWRTFARRVARELPNGNIAFDYDPAIAQSLAQTAGTEPPDLKPLFAALAPKPVLLLRGALSDILSLDGVEEMRKIKSDLEYAEVPNVGHAPTLEEPQALQALERFLSHVPSASGRLLLR